MLTKDMLVTNARLAQRAVVAAQSVLRTRPGNSRDRLSGDVVGLVNPGPLRHQRHAVRRRPRAVSTHPHFPAEFFGALRLRDVKFKL
ncbi:MAG: hypothetical protein R2712_27935 [Vicinamibacterales bacterium]